MPDKLERMLAALLESEIEVGHDVPQLIYGDAVVASESLEVIHASFRQYTSRLTDADAQDVAMVMLGNVAPGCAMLGNAALRRAALPVHPDARMHDWWVTMVALSQGKSIQMDQTVLFYRQHGSNALGVPQSGMMALKLFLRSPSSALNRARKMLDRTTSQARAFASTYGEAGRNATVAGYGRISRKSLIARKTFLFRNKVRAADWGTFIALMLVI